MSSEIINKHFAGWKKFIYIFLVLILHFHGLQVVVYHQIIYMGRGGGARIKEKGKIFTT